MSPTPRSAVILAAISLGALVLPLWLVAALALALVGATLADAARVRHPPHVRRTLPTLVARGVPADLRLAMESPVPLPHGVRAWLRQPLPPDVEMTPSHSPDVLVGSLVAHRRGVHELPRPAVSLIGPLGLARWHHRPGDAEVLTVYPDLYAASAIVDRIRTGRFRDADGAHRGALGLGTEFEQIRDYQPDDDVRQVNWLATARAGRTMTNTYRLERDRTIVCLIDTGRLMAAPVAGRTRLDAAVDAAVAIASVADEVGDAIGFVAFNSQVVRTLSPKRSGARTVAEALVDLEPTSADADYELAFRSVGTTKRSLVVVLTDLLDAEAARTLIEATEVLARRHAVIVASVVDPGLAAIVERDPTSTGDAHEQAAAVELLESRRRAVRALRATGARVVESSADGLGAACVGAYLTLKALARL